MNQGGFTWGVAWIVCKTIALVLLLALPVTESAAQTLPVLGYVDNEKDNPERLEAFRQGLSELGYLEGKNIIITFRHAKLDRDYVSLATELVGLKVNIILVGNAPAAVAARHATRTIPIVMGVVIDPVRLGLINSLEHPGTNVTGTTMFAPQLIGERLQIIRSMVPAIDKVAMLVNGNNANNSSQFELLRSSAEAVGIKVQVLDVRNPPDIEPAIVKAMASGSKALFNCVDNFINSQRFTIAKLAAENKLPVIYTDFEYVVVGGLMSLGPGHLEGFHGAAKYVDLILRGAKPAELPIAGPTQFTFSVSRAALNHLSLTLPSNVSSRVNDWRP
jgi:putative ABC transport system substrate-binding protein